VSSVLGFYRRRLAGADAKGSGKSGAVVVVQLRSSDLKLNPHFHALFLDGAYRPAHGDAPVFCPLPRLSTSDVADVLETVRVRILGYLVRHGVVGADPEPSWIDADRAPRDPVLAQLAAAAVSGLPTAGPELRQRPPIPLRGRPGVIITAPLAVAEQGFSLHAATHAGAHDLRGREALVKYPAPAARRRAPPPSPRRPRPHPAQAPLS
jgi:hypothetical protein